MPIKWVPQSNQVYLHWVNTILEEAQNTLSEWESGFVESIAEKLLRGYSLTELQANKLESIYSAKTK